jgi:hypothetical protein
MQMADLSIPLYARKAEKEFVPEGTNPNFQHVINDIDIRPRYSLDTPYPVDPNPTLERWQMHRGLQNVKKSHVPLRMTDEMIDELERCANDVVYWASRYFYIRTLDSGRIKIKLYPFQAWVLRALEYQEVRNFGLLTSRQASKTTVISAFTLHKIIFNEDYLMAIAANGGGAARELFGRVSLAYSELPAWMQIGVKHIHGSAMSLQTGSGVWAGNSNADAFRGQTLNDLLVDEAAFVPDSYKFFNAILPTISSGTMSKSVLLSTPNGKKGFYYDQMSKGMKGLNDWFTLRIPWYYVPGRSQEWARTQIRNSSLEQFRQEYGAEFLGSSLNLIDNNTLEKIEATYIHDPIQVVEKVRVYAHPVKDASYVMIVDTAEGKGQDRSTFSIFRVDTRPMEQVVAYHSDEISPLIYAVFLKRWAEAYNNALVVIENNNASGALVASNFYLDLEYENTFLSNAVDETGIGVRTTHKVKSLGCATLRSLLKFPKTEETHPVLIIHDQETLNELYSFEASGASFAAADEAHDDLVQNLWMLAWFTNNAEFERFLVEGRTIIDEAMEDDIETIENMEMPTFEEIAAASSAGSKGDFW